MYPTIMYNLINLDFILTFKATMFIFYTALSVKDPRVISCNTQAE